MTKVVVIGLGYVGLPLALLADKKGYDVTGLDIDETKIKSLGGGRSYIDDISNEAVKNSNVHFTTDPQVVGQAGIVIVCVPTPVHEDKLPDLRPLKGALTSVAPHLKDHTLVVVESTINPGVCDEVVIPLLESQTKKKIGKDIYLAHCPERINPGDSKWDVSNINRVVGANSEKELRLARDFYESIIDAQIKPMGTLKEAEAVKIVENSFRDINIAFVNELAMSFHKLGINLENVIDGAATKPFAFMAHHPGCGVGGHCIPVDPYYLIDYARGYGFDHEFLKLARRVNENMPNFTIDLLEEGLKERGLKLKGAKVTLLGLSYKANVADGRESPAYKIRALLEKTGADLKVFDPYIAKDSTANSLEETLDHADALIIATGHKAFIDLMPDVLTSAGVKVVIDGRNIFRHFIPSFEEADITYKGVGVN